MPSNTTNYSFQKPVVGADEDDWGGYLNSNWDSLDTLLSDGSPFHIDTTNNRIGIGTDTPAVSLDLTSLTDAVAMPVGTTLERPTGVNGQIRYNSTDNSFEGYADGIWGSIGGGASGGGPDTVFYENGQSVTTDYTIEADKNAMSTGPITLDAGATITIETGARWVVI